MTISPSAASILAGKVYSAMMAAFAKHGNWDTARKAGADVIVDHFKAMDRK